MHPSTLKVYQIYGVVVRSITAWRLLKAEVPSHLLVIRLLVLWSVAGVGGSETVQT